ncbi:LOW QUALITY PROTEIN: Keratin, type I cytoskeletal 18 [Plecturocebus cupreus]
MPPNLRTSPRSCQTDIQAQYDELAWKNQEQLDKYWSQHIEESITVVTMQSFEVVAAEMMLVELRHAVQSLEIDLDLMRNLKASLENNLREVMDRYSLAEGAAQWDPAASGVRAGTDLGRGTALDPRALLNTKAELEAEIATYRRLLEDGEDFNLGDTLDSSNSMQTIQKTTTSWIVDHKMVSETNNTKDLRH